jgi:hypothetical protein
MSFAGPYANKRATAYFRPKKLNSAKINQLSYQTVYMFCGACVCVCVCVCVRARACPPWQTRVLSFVCTKCLQNCDTRRSATTNGCTLAGSITPSSIIVLHADTVPWVRACSPPWSLTRRTESEPFPVTVQPVRYIPCHNVCRSSSTLAFSFFFLRFFLSFFLPSLAVSFLFSFLISVFFSFFQSQLASLFLIFYLLSVLFLCYVFGTSSDSDRSNSEWNMPSARNLKGSSQHISRECRYLFARGCLSRFVRAANLSPVENFHCRSEQDLENTYDELGQMSQYIN